MINEMLRVYKPVTFTPKEPFLKEHFLSQLGVFFWTDILGGDLLTLWYPSHCPHLQSVVRKFDSLGVTLAIMIHVGKQGIETSERPLARAKVHVDTVGVHNVHSLQNFLLREHVTKL